jgi:hypothetical protein
MPKIHPLPQIAVAPPLPNPPPVRDTRVAAKAEPFLMPAMALVDPSGPSAQAVAPATLATVRAAFTDWLGGKPCTKRKAREFLSRFAGRTVTVR